MSNEIEIGEYVKTKKGFIGKLINIDTKNEAYYLDCGKCVSLVNIIKHSKKIIDLIEEGDFVNGMEIDEFDDEEGNSFLGIPIYDDSLMDCIEEVRPLSTIEIKSILTKEQYEQNCFKVKE